MAGAVGVAGVVGAVGVVGVVGVARVASVADVIGVNGFVGIAFASIVHLPSSILFSQISLFIHSPIQSSLLQVKGVLGTLLLVLLIVPVCLCVSVTSLLLALVAPLW